MAVMLDNMSHGVAMFDGSLKLAARNRQFEQMFELPAALFTTPPSFADLVRYLGRRGEFGDVDVEEHVALILQDVEEQHGTEHVRPNGTVIEIRNNPVPGGGFVSIYSDITDRKRAEQQSRESEQRMRSILEGSPIGAAISVETDACCSATRNSRARTDSRATISKESTSSRSLPTRRSARACSSGRAATAASAISRSRAAERMGGIGGRSTRWTRSSTRARRRSSPGTTTITDLKDREAALAAAQADVDRTRAVMQTVLDNMSEGVMLFDKDFRSQFVNRQLMTFNELPPELGRPGTSGPRPDSLHGRARATTGWTPTSRRSLTGASR